MVQKRGHGQWQTRMPIDPLKEEYEEMYFGPVRDRGEWRIHYNEELTELIEGCDIVRFMKAQRIRWLGHVERISEDWMSKRML